MLFCLALWSGGALAQEKVEPYLGGALGQFDFHATALSYKVYGGVRIDDTWAIEGSYGETDELTGAPILGPVNTTVRAQYDFLAVRGLVHVKAFLGGIGYWQASVDDTPFSPNWKSDAGVSIVLGGQWDLDRIGIRVEAEAYDMDSADAGYNYAVGVHYRF
jgi:hypothetical protein